MARLDCVPLNKIEREEAMTEQTPNSYDEIEKEFGIEGLEDLEEMGENNVEGGEKEENAINPPPAMKKAAFQVAAVILLILIGLFGLAYYAAIWLPQHRAQQLARQAMNDIIQTEVVNNQSQMLLPSSSPLPIIEVSPADTESIDFTAAMTKAYEPTPVIAVPSPTIAITKEEDLDPLRTATVSALLTEAAIITQPSEMPQETIPPTIPSTSVAFSPTELATPLATALPKTGWMEDVGLPSMGLLALGCILIIIIVRIIRTSRSES